MYIPLFFYKHTQMFISVKLVSILIELQNSDTQVAIGRALQT
jgi:hypothetical protein